MAQRRLAEQVFWRGRCRENLGENVATRHIRPLCPHADREEERIILPDGSGRRPGEKRGQQLCPGAAVSDVTELVHNAPRGHNCL